MKHKFRPLNEILLRVPLQSIQELNKCFNKDITELIEIGNPLFMEGLYLSSPEYLIELFKKAGNTCDDKSRDFKKLIQTYYKYWIRSCTRCTPFGTFAACGIVKLSNRTLIQLPELESFIKHSRIDMNFLNLLIITISKIPNVQNQLLFYPNNSLYQANDTYRYTEYSVKNESRFYYLNSVPKTPYLDLIIQLSHEGAKISYLIDNLLKFDNVTESQARSYILELIDSQILISNLEPNITGENPLKTFISTLSTLTNINSLTNILIEINYKLEEKEITISDYDEIKKIFSRIDIPFDIPKNIFQTDLFFSSPKNEIKKDIIEQIVDQVSALSVISRKNLNNNLDDFKLKFYEKYEDQEISLMVALDAEMGIGYGSVNDASTGSSELIEGLLIGHNKVNSINYDFINQFILSKYIDCIMMNKNEIEISDDDLHQLSEKNIEVNQPNSMSIIGNLHCLKNVNEGIDDFKFHLIAYTGPSGANLISRFSHGDSKINNLIKDIVTKEQESENNYILAEIVHLPQARIGNILLRPILRNYEIPYVGISGATKEFQIPLTDIIISIKNGLIVLKSISLNKEIKPRLSTAHNFNFQGLPVYKFLCDLQFQNLNTMINWDWGVLKDSLHLPRVIYKNIILEKAKWILSKKDIINLPKDCKLQISFFQELILLKKIPELVLLSQGDNELLINFNVQESIELLVDYLNKQSSITLTEYLFNEENCIVDRNTKKFTSEIIIPIFKEVNPIFNSNIRFTPNETEKVQRVFPPNSEWAYLKIYIGSKQGETFLTSILLPLLKNFIEQGMVEKFFFIRYFDTQPHLRLRFQNSGNHSNNSVILKDLINSVNLLVESGIVSKIIVDTYSRELERYNYDNILLSESIFHNDSIAVLNIINLIEGSEGDYYRWIIALVGIDCLLNDFNLSLEQKAVLLDKSSQNFFKEFGGSKILKKQLDDKYRNHQKAIFNFLNSKNASQSELSDVIDIFNYRSQMNIPIIKNILENLSKYNVGLFQSELIPSYIHMFMNRLFITQQRKQELVVYHFLSKYYNSQLSILKIRQLTEV